MGGTASASIPRRSLSGDSNHHRGLSGGSGHSRGFRRSQIRQEQGDNRSLSSGGSGHSRGLRKSQARSSTTPNVAHATSRSLSPNRAGLPNRVAAAPNHSIPLGSPSNGSSVKSLPMRSSSVDATESRGLRRGKKPAPIQSEPTIARAEAGAASSSSMAATMPNSDVKGLRRSRATAPGVVSESIGSTRSSGRSLSPVPPADGKIRGRARATAPGAVSESVNATSGTEPASSERRQLSPKRVVAAMSTPPATTNQEDAQAIRRKEIQEIMKDSRLSHAENNQRSRNSWPQGCRNRHHL